MKINVTLIRILQNINLTNHENKLFISIERPPALLRMEESGQ